ILCAVFFGMGFSMGKNSVKSTPELLPSPSQSGARGSTVKPATSSGTTSSPQAAQAAPANSGDSSQPAAGATQSAPDQGPTRAPPGPGGTDCPRCGLFCAGSGGQQAGGRRSAG